MLRVSEDPHPNTTSMRADLQARRVFASLEPAERVLSSLNSLLTSVYGTVQ